MSSFENNDLGDYEYGRPIRLSQFSHHDSNVIRLNNGSFGSCPKDVQLHRQSLQNLWCKNPDDFWHSLERRFRESSAAIATNLLGGCNPDDVMVVDNLTVAHSVIVNSIIANMKDGPNSVVLMSNVTYGSIQKSIYYGVQLASQRSSVPEPPSVYIINIPFPILTDNFNEIILKAYRDTLDRIRVDGRIVSLAFLDHISSLPALMMPVVDIVALLREYGTKEVSPFCIIFIKIICDFLYYFNDCNVDFFGWSSLSRPIIIE